MGLPIRATALHRVQKTCKLCTAYVSHSRSEAGEYTLGPEAVRNVTVDARKSNNMVGYAVEYVVALVQ